MSTSHTVTREQARAITEDLRSALAEVFARHGLTAPQLKTTYGDVYKVAASGSPIVLNDEGINTLSPEAIAYQRLGRVYGLRDGLLGKTISVSGKQATFIGIAPKRPKYPFMFSVDGKTVLYTEAVREPLNATVL